MKKETKKLMVAGIVMALSCAAWGSVQAADYTDVINNNINDIESNITNKDKSVSLTVNNKEVSITSEKIGIEATEIAVKDSSQKVTTRGINVTAGNGEKSKLMLGNENTKEISIKASGNYFPIGMACINQGSSGALGSEIIVTTKKLDIDVNGGEYASAIQIQNNTQKKGTTEDPIPDSVAKVIINADTINISSNKTGLAVLSNSNLTMNGDLVLNSNEDAINARGYSKTNINMDGTHKTVIHGDINFGTPNEQGGDSHNSGNKIDATLNINFAGEGSSFTGKAYQELGDKVSIALEDNIDYYGNATGLNLNFADGAQWNMTGDSFANHVTVENGSSINVTENVKNANIDKVKLDNGTVNLQGTEQKVKVNTADGTGTIATTSLDNQLTVGTKDETANLKVQGSGAIGDQILAGQASLNDLAKVVAVQSDTSKSAANTVETKEGIIAGKISAQVGDNGQVIANSVKEAVNTDNQAISNMATLSLMTWRQENNDMNKRLGELRASQGSQGVWARMARGQAKYGEQSIKNQYNYYQLGYDSKISDDWILGGAFTYTDGESSYTNGSGTNKHTGFAVYGSNLRDDGSFIDIIAKYAHMKNDFDVNGGVGTGDYSTNGYSFSAEYGKRFQQEGFWIEPQAELTYGKVSSADFTTKNGASVHQDSMDSLVGRLGFSLGKDIKQGNVYVRASYLYDFQGDTNVTMSKEGGLSRSFKTDLGGGWWEFGVGTNLNLGHDTHFYLDVETTAGGDVDTPWQWNAGVRFSF